MAICISCPRLSLILFDMKVETGNSKNVFFLMLSQTLEDKLSYINVLVQNVKKLRIIILKVDITTSKNDVFQGFMLAN